MNWLRMGVSLLTFSVICMKWQWNKNTDRAKELTSERRRLHLGHEFPREVLNPRLLINHLLPAPLLLSERPSELLDFSVLVFHVYQKLRGLFLQLTLLKHQFEVVL